MCVIAGCPKTWVNRHPIWYHGKNLKNPFKLFLNSYKNIPCLDYSGSLSSNLTCFELNMPTTTQRGLTQKGNGTNMGAGSSWPFTQGKPIATALTGLELVHFCSTTSTCGFPLLSTPLPLQLTPFFLDISLVEKLLHTLT